MDRQDVSRPKPYYSDGDVTLSDAARRCIDRHVRDLPDRVTVAQALGLLPDVGRARNTSRERGVTVERGVSC